MFRTYLFLVIPLLLWSGRVSATTCAAQMVAAAEFFEVDVPHELKKLSCLMYRTGPWDLPIDQLKVSDCGKTVIATARNGNVFISPRVEPAAIRWSGGRWVGRLDLSRAVLASGDGDEWMAPLQRPRDEWVYGIGSQIVQTDESAAHGAFLLGSTGLLVRNFYSGLRVVTRNPSPLKLYEDSREELNGVQDSYLRVGADLVAVVPNSVKKVLIYRATKDDQNPLVLLNEFRPPEKIIGLEISPTGKHALLQTTSATYLYYQDSNEWRRLVSPEGFAYEKIKFSADGTQVIRAGAVERDMSVVVSEVRSGKNTFVHRSPLPVRKDVYNDIVLFPDASGGGWTFFFVYPDKNNYLEGYPLQSWIDVFRIDSSSMEFLGTLAKLPSIRSIEASPTGAWLKIEFGVPFSYEAEGETKYSQLLMVERDDSDRDPPTLAPEPGPQGNESTPSGSLGTAK